MSPIYRYPTGYRTYFTEFSFEKGLFYAIILIIVVAMTVVSFLSPFLLPEYCLEKPFGATQPQQSMSEIHFGNALFPYNPCRFHRRRELLYLTPMECSYGRRLIIAVLLGGIIGWERRSADRPAGIRTMALVCLGSSLFTITSTFAFLDGPMGWDSSRVSAAIPSGVGFLGAGLIFKQAEKDEQSGEMSHVVHGLTTAASVWVAAAVGVACGGEMYVAAIFCVGVMALLLRFGPRLNPSSDEEGGIDEDEALEEHVAEFEEHRVEFMVGELSPSKRPSGGGSSCGGTIGEQTKLLAKSDASIPSHASRRRTASQRRQAKPSLATFN